ncbi:hypothetical protein WM40_25820 [Robbsia andropogonis]|uniref:Uncharacterized protein n=1 Tax=Robbsia andropogonis TaxID=28092 RepID=A0A0F5JT16_9BURK|nr:hypothetical protein WM40_25820 [Robbsia andropogonis]
MLAVALNADGHSRLVATFTEGAKTNQLIVDSKVTGRYAVPGPAVYDNSEAFANEFVKNDPNFLKLVMLDHASNDWRDVLCEPRWILRRLQSLREWSYEQEIEVFL